jgi:hypothetical protein
MHAAYFTHDQSAAGDATSSVAIVKLPAGRVRLLLGASMVYVNWTTASATIDIGWDAYTGFDGVAVVADPDGLVNGTPGRAPTRAIHRHPASSTPRLERGASSDAPP